MPESVIKFAKIPAQMKDAEEAEKVDTMATASSDTVASTIGSNYFLNFLFFGSMSQVWSLANSMQVVQYNTLFDLKTPGNVQAFMDVFSEITSLKLLDFAEFVESSFYIPEQDSFSLNFQNAGYETKLFVVNAEIWLIISVVMGGIHVILLLLSWPISYWNNGARWVRQRVQYNLFWNGSLRIFMEAYLDIAVMSLLNIHEVVWPEGLEAVRFSNLQSYIILALCVTLPLLLLCHMCRHR